MKLASIIATYRLLFTILLILPFVLWKHLREIRLIPLRDWYLPESSEVCSRSQAAYLSAGATFASAARHYLVISSLCSEQLQLLVTGLGEPIGAAILAYFILREKVTAVQVIGTAVILCGIYLFIHFNRSDQTKPSSKNDQPGAAAKSR
ncbi:EamA family transporter [Aneurinibacillus aneurinilyticus]|uniref:EamA family transporter n=1 Tax=Aneurinibacillus aneurinilyticus TaxID=1391 RepID=UPI003F9600A0